MSIRFRGRSDLAGLALTVALSACSAQDGAVESTSDHEIFLTIDELGPLSDDLPRAVIDGLQRCAMEHFSGVAKVLAANVERFPWSGETLYRFHLVDDTTGQIALCDLDTAGRPADEAEFRENERVARIETSGKIDPKLRLRLKDMRANERRWVAVSVAISTEDLPTDRTVGAGLLRAQKTSQRVSASLETLLSVLGHVPEMRRPATDAPFVMMHLDRNDIQRLEEADAVGAIFDSEPEELPPLGHTCDYQVPNNHYWKTETTEARYLYNAWGRGDQLLGNGTSVGILSEALCDETNLPFDPTDPATSHVPATVSCGDNSVHGSVVAGYVQNTNPLDPENPSPGPVKGIAPEATVLSANVAVNRAIAIKCSSYTANVPGPNHSWQLQSGGAIGSQMQALPVLGTGYYSGVTNSPRLDYEVTFKSPGTYYVWVHGTAIAGSVGTTDSLHVGLDGLLQSTSDKISGFGSSYAWKRGTMGGGAAYITVPSAGQHTVNVWMREDGFKFDVLMLTDDSSFVPTNSTEAAALLTTTGSTGHGPADAWGWAASNGVDVASLTIATQCLNVAGCATEPQDLWTALGDYYSTHDPFVLTVAGAGNAVTTPIAEDGDAVANWSHNGLVIGAAKPGTADCGTFPCQSEPDRETAKTESTWRYRNPPPDGDWELPHMTAYGRDLVSSIADGCQHGTSFSTPIVAGAAALLLQGNAALSSYPPATKAALLAGADVNTDLNSDDLGSAYSHLPRYNSLAYGVGEDRHGGVGLLSTRNSLQLVEDWRQIRDNRRNVDVNYALANTSPAIQTYQSTIYAERTPSEIGHDYGTMDPNVDFDGIWYRHFYYFTVTTSGYLRIALAWDQPYTCSFNPTSCGANFKPDLNMLLRDLDSPTSAVATGVTWDPNEEFIVAQVEPGKTYRLDIYKQNYWPGPNAFGLAAHFTTNPQ